VKHSRALVATAFLAVYVFWGSTYLGSKFAMASFPPTLLAGIRFLLGGAAMAAIMFATRRLRLSDFARLRWWINCGMAGICLFAMANVLVSTAVQRIPSGIAALVASLTSIWIVAADRAITRAGAPEWSILLGLACGIGGVAVLGWPAAEQAHGGLDTVGVLIAAASTLAWATGTMVGKHTEKPPSLWAASVIQMLVGGAVALGWSALTEHARWPAAADIKPSALWAIAYLVTFGSLVGFTAYVWLVDNVSAAAVATYAYVNPLVAMALGAMLAGESIPPRTGIAGLLILGSVALIQFVRPPKRGEMPVEEQ
jgi:drug/metabolite transporter (DMT)-like permease